MQLVRNQKATADTVTVAVTTFRRHQLVQETLRSLLQQTVDNFEIYVGNNDHNMPLSDEFLGIDGTDRITYFNHRCNLGQMENMRFLLGACQSRWFTWLNDDDLMHPQCIEVLLAAAQNCKEEPVAVYCDYLATPTPAGLWKIGKRQSSTFNGADFALRYAEQKIPLLGIYGLLDARQLRESAALRNLGQAWWPYADTLIPMVLAARGPIAYVKNKLFLLRTHPGSLSVKSPEPRAYLSAQRDFLDVVLESWSGRMDQCSLQACVWSLLRWFARDHWHVLMRSAPGKRWRNARTLFRDQLESHARRLEIGMRPRFCFYLLHLVTKKYRHRIHQALSGLRRGRR